MGLRGFHVYHQTENWNPFYKENVRFRREVRNKGDRFAVAGHVRMPGRLGRVVVGHVPRELSRFIWHAILWGCEFNGFVFNPRRRRSPLTQGGLEIELEVEVWWGDEEKAKKLKDHIMTCSYPEEYEDESKKILQEIRGPEVNDGASSDDEEYVLDETIAFNVFRQHVVTLSRN